MVGNIVHSAKIVRVFREPTVVSRREPTLALGMALAHKDDRKTQEARTCADTKKAAVLEIRTRQDLRTELATKAIPREARLS